MKPDFTRNSNSFHLTTLSILSGFFFICLGLLLSSQIYYHETFYPGVTIQGKSLAGLTKDQARQIMAQELTAPQTTITLTAGEQSISSSSAELGLHYNYENLIDQAFAIGHQGSLWQKILSLTETLTTGINFTSKLVFEPAAVETMVEELKKQVDKPGVDPVAVLATSNNPNTLKIQPGKFGSELRKTSTINSILTHSSPTDISLEALVASTSSQLNQEQIEAAHDRASKFVGQTIKLQADNINISVNDQELVATLAFVDGFSSKKMAELMESWQTATNRAPQNAVFEYDPTTLAVTTFQPDRAGLKLDVGQTKEKFVQLLSTIEQAESSSDPQTHQLDLPVVEAAPEITLAKTNDLGITERIGLGESNYDHSIPSRIHNVALTTKKINNTIIPPGAEFSFNKTLGEVSARTGYRPAYVIRGNRTELGDGGGVCQVSTTVFRSVLDAGLEVTKRLQHSYRVSYYEQGFKPGIDATVYAGDIDFRFVNDTDHHILITGQADSNNLYMYIELYGTSDGRTTEITDHNVWDARGPLPSEYYDDPSLPPGTVKQIDWSAGGVKASFTNVIKDKEGTVIRQDEYYSNYRPWAAKYLRGV